MNRLKTKRTGGDDYCTDIDPWFIVSEFKEKAKIIRTAREINNYKTEWVIEKIKNKALEFELKEGRRPIIACFGLAFKADIDDLRESPALQVVNFLNLKGLPFLLSSRMLVIKVKWNYFLLMRQ